MKIDTLIISHGIKMHKNYVFSADDLYVLEHFKNKRMQKTKKLSLQKNGSTNGYFINRVFKSLDWIEKRKYPKTEIRLNYLTDTTLPF